MKKQTTSQQLRVQTQVRAGYDERRTCYISCKSLRPWEVKPCQEDCEKKYGKPYAE